LLPTANSAPLANGQPEVVDEAGRTQEQPVSPQVIELYLNPRFFRIRAAGYFVVWSLLAFLLLRPVRRGPQRSRARRRVAAAGLVLLGLSCTFASIDWGMSLDPHWYSTMYGALVAVGASLAGLALATGSAATLKMRASQDSDFIPLQALADMGTLMLAFVMLWAYCAFSQFLIIWSGNLPEENVWYIARLTGGWQWLALAAICLEFAVPFGLLLSRELKQNPSRLAGVALLVFVMQFVYMAWTIMPSLRPGYVSVRLSDLAAPVALGGIWMTWFTTLLRRRLRVIQASPREIT
jgi:hypothetical protein